MRPWVLLPPFLVLAACGELLSPSDDDDVTPTPPPSADASAPTDGTVADATPPKADATLCASPEPRLAAATEDTSALECAGSISYGNADFANIGFGGVGLMYVKFDVPGDVAAALASGRVAAARLVLREEPKPGVQSDGVLAAHVLRNDWAAGQGDPPTYGGADRCRRDIGNPGSPWGTSSMDPSIATVISEGPDYDPAVGSQAFVAADTQVTIKLDLGLLRAHWQKRAPSGGDLSMMIEETTPNGTFVAATADNSSVSSRPTIIFDVCP